MEEGAIETFLITAELLRSTEPCIGGMQWSTWVSGLPDIGADLIQCSSDHDAGQQLIGMGGAIALLRYAM
jgi:stalled ribosome rescue protein Dom34